MKHLFILNPAAGGKRNRHAEIERTLRDFAARLSDPFEIYITKAPMDATQKVAKEADTGVSLRVYACGGDGTLNECVGGAAGRENVAVTHYPCGTGNDFIKMFGENDSKKFFDLAELTNGTVRPIDIIDCNGRYGINICSVGIDARIGTDVHKYSGIPIIGGATGYIVSLVVNVLKGVKQKFSITAGKVTMSGQISLVCACNGRFYGGGFNPIPNARPDDGLLDYLIIEGVSRLKLIFVVGKYAKGRFNELGDMATHVRSSSMEICSNKEFVVNIDGESLYTNKVSFRVIPKGINFIFPEKMEFFSSHGQISSVNQRN